MSEAKMLDVELCERLKENWRGAPLLGRLQPGLSNTEMDALTAPLGLSLPVEARTWWGWHDGAQAEQYAYERELGGGYEFLSLEDAVTQYRQLRAIAADMAQNADSHGPEGPMTDPDWWWSPTWFPVVIRGGPVLACECAVPEGAPSPILYVEFHEAAEWLDMPGGRPVRAASFGEMVEAWLRAYASGGWRFDTAEDQWGYDYELLDPADELKRLV